MTDASVTRIIIKSESKLIPKVEQKQITEDMLRTIETTMDSNINLQMIKYFEKNGNIVEASRGSGGLRHAALKDLCKKFIPEVPATQLTKKDDMVTKLLEKLAKIKDEKNDIYVEESSEDESSDEEDEEDYDYENI